MPYKQCRLIKKVEGGYITDIAFIPSIHAKTNKQIQIKKDGVFEDGWIVGEVGIMITDEQADKMHEWYTSFKKVEVAGRKSYGK